MEILLIEDDKCKIKDITRAIEQELSTDQFTLTISSNLSDARIKLLTNYYQLIIFDIYLPHSEGRNPCNVSTEILTDFAKSMNYQSEAITLTKYEMENIDNISLFNENGVNVVKYDDSSKWKHALEFKITKAKYKVKYDFIIFCALEKERSAYSQTKAEIGSVELKNGFSTQSISINSYHGLCITPSDMGLVNMAILSSKAIELYQPKIVAMSGICAGVKGEANLLDIIVPNICWEYQTGKYKDNQFKQEPYQCAIDHQVKVKLQHLISDVGLLESLKKDLYKSELSTSKIVLQPMSSGSAVIADKRIMDIIGNGHRKMAGLEMEMYSLFQAASQSNCKPLYFGAKSVVDMGDSSKGDRYHPEACILSARFVCEALNSLLSD